MRKFIFVFLLPVIMVSMAAGAEERKVPSRFFLNNDGDRAIKEFRGPFQLGQLHYPVDILAGTGVTTLVYCGNLGSDLAYYPSKAASSLDWRMTESHRPDNPNPVYPRVYRVGKMLREQGIDILGLVMQRAKEKGLEFVPSLRMNDAHFAQKLPPAEHPLTGEFWMKHQDLTIGPIDPARGTFPEYCPYLLNFEHEAVREYRMGQIYELIDGYAADGFEMDFTRHYLFFPPGREKPELITDMVRKAHQRLAEKNQKDGKDRFLIVRVADTVEHCRRIGLDVPVWMKEGLVEYVVPSSFLPNILKFRFDIPLGEFLALAEGTHCRIVAGPDAFGANGDIYRAGMANYFSMGQKDVYLFNFYFPHRDEDYAMLRDIQSPQTLWGRPKDFHVQEFFPADELKLEEANRAYPVRIYIGDDLLDYRQAGILRFARLIFEFDSLHSSDRFEITLNNQPVPPQAIWADNNRLQAELRTGPLPIVGWNTFTIIPKSFGGTSQPILKNVHLKTDYDLTGGGDKSFVAEPFLKKERIKLLETDMPYTVTLNVEEDLEGCRRAKILKSEKLLIQIKYQHPLDQFEFSFNGTPVPVPPVEKDGMSHWIDLQGNLLPHVGENTVTVKVKTFGRGNRPNIPYLRHVRVQTDYDLSTATEGNP